ncbi:MAG TPA: formate dehydrogenase accessory sulfurtransferase FdhD [bacterium]|nr:formate dehydrogenase accessory sulfurtransferase FdhD [bacterium]
MMISKMEIVKYKNGIRQMIVDDLVTELKLTIAYQKRELTTVLCSPSDIEDLAAGYLYTSGLLSKTDITSIQFDREKGVVQFDLTDDAPIKEMILSKLEPVGCGGGKIVFFKKDEIRSILPEVTVSAETIGTLMNEFNNSSSVFKTTGGVHSAAISDGNSILVFREDIGRHNAVDKAVGHMYLSKQAVNNKILLTSGRISSEIVMKIANCDIKVIISRSAPTLRAVELANENGMTLIGFARAGNFNVYSNHQRVIFEKN